MAAARAWGVVAAAVLLVTACAAVDVQNDTALDAMLPTTSVGHFDPAKYALPLPSNATNASGKGEASTGIITSNTTIPSVHRSRPLLSVRKTPFVYILYQRGRQSLGIGVEGAKIESAAPSPSASLGSNSSSTNATVESVPGFVKTQGQQFSLNGRAAYFAGTNAW